MKNNILFVSVLAVLLFTSCKGDKSNEIKEIKKEEPKNQFTVSVDAIVKKDDDFQIFYNEDGTESFNGEMSVNVSIKGSNEVQEIVFKLPEDALPSSLRFDIGGNESQEEVKIVNFKMNYFDKNFIAKDTLFKKYFYPNEQIKYDDKTAVAKPNKITGQPYDPIFMATNDLKSEIEKLTKG